jgi:hypothetical protein
LFVRRWRKVPVPNAHSAEIFRPGGANHFIHFWAEFGACFGRSDWYGDDKSSGTLYTQGLDGGAHGRSGGEAVVDEDDRAPGYDGRRSIFPKKLLLAVKLRSFPNRHLFDHVVGNLQSIDDVIVQHLDSTYRDRSHSKLRMCRQPQLAHEEDVERSLKRLRHFKPDRRPAAGESQNGNIGLASIVSQLPGEELSRFKSIFK